jgi:tRNA pseudouridine13 synthase
MFLQNFKEGVEEFLMKSYPKESKIVQKCRNELKETQNFERALIDFPRSLFYEHKLIGSLVKNPSNYLKALKQLPKPLTNLLYSSYQSFLFNSAISERVLKGHSLFLPKKGDKISILHSVNGLNSPIVFSYEKNYRKHLDKAKNLDRAAILCPIIGYKTDLTDCYFGPIYRKLLKRENFSQNDFKNSKLSSFIYKGTYRPISIKPRAFSVKYFEKSKKINSAHIILKFSLPKGTYATMLLRELIKN